MDTLAGNPPLQMEEGGFRILQLTDFHSDVSEYLNERTRADVRAMVARHRPHFLAVTGDIWCGDGHPDVAGMWMARDVEFLASLETPWAFTWGNHDYAADPARVHGRIASAPHYAAPRSTARGECHLEIQGAGAIPAWDIFFVNSGPEWTLPRDLEWLQTHSATLGARRGRSLPAVVFFHIPLRCYQDAINDGRARGIALEEVLCWGDEAGGGAGLIAQSANVRACFCGHSHRNDCWFEEAGVIFSYGRSTGYGGYGDDVKKGAKLITLGERGAIDFESVFADGTRWRPESS